MERERKLVTLGMIILFFGLIVVYLLFYQVRGKRLHVQVDKNIPSPSHENPSPTIPLWGGEENTQAQNNTETIQGKTPGTIEGDSYSDILTGIDALQGEERGNQTASSESNLVFEGEAPIVLSGTDMYFGAVESIELLGLEPDYILKDAKGFYYARFKKRPEIKKTVQDLGGNIYTISSEAELLKNKLFGDQIRFINLPEHKEKLVMMFVNLQDERWLVQMDYSKYHQAKSYLQSLFIQ